MSNKSSYTILTAGIDGYSSRARVVPEIIDGPWEIRGSTGPGTWNSRNTTAREGEKRMEREKE